MNPNVCIIIPGVQICFRTEPSFFKQHVVLPIGLLDKYFLERSLLFKVSNTQINVVVYYYSVDCISFQLNRISHQLQRYKSTTR